MTLTLLGAAGLFLACGGKKVIVEDRHYSLVLEAAEDRPPSTGAPAEARVALTAVALPDFLMLKNLTLQTSSNELTIARHHLWAEPLDEAVRKVLVWDLSAQLPTLDVAYGPRRDADCALAVEFDRLHPSSSARVLVSGRYTLTHGAQVTRREFDVSQPIWADGYSSAVAVMRQSLAALSEELQPLIEACAAQSAPPPAD